MGLISVKEMTSAVSEANMDRDSVPGKDLKTVFVSTREDKKYIYYFHFIVKLLVLIKKKLT